MPYKLSASLSAHSSDVRRTLLGFPIRCLLTWYSYASQVRAVASPIDTLILSASRDTTAVSWTRPSPTEPFVQSPTFRAGSRFVNAIAYIPPTLDAPKGTPFFCCSGVRFRILNNGYLWHAGYVVTGGTDTVINVFPLDSTQEEPAYSLLGHTENVCALNATESGLIISGSWDRRVYLLLFA